MGKIGAVVKGATKAYKAAAPAAGKTLRGIGWGLGTAINVGGTANLLNQLLATVGLPHLGMGREETNALGQYGEGVMGLPQNLEIERMLRQEQSIGSLLDTLDRGHKMDARSSMVQESASLSELDHLLQDKHQALAKLSVSSIPTMREIVAAMGA